MLGARCRAPRGALSSASLPSRRKFSRGVPCSVQVSPTVLACPWSPPPSSGRQRVEPANPPSRQRKLSLQAGLCPPTHGDPSFSPRRGLRQEGAPIPSPGFPGLPGGEGPGGRCRDGRLRRPRGVPDPSPVPFFPGLLTVPQRRVLAPAWVGGAPEAPSAYRRARGVQGPWVSWHFPFAVSPPAYGNGV